MEGPKQDLMRIRHYKYLGSLLHSQSKYMLTIKISRSTSSPHSYDREFCFYRTFITALKDCWIIDIIFEKARKYCLRLVLPSIMSCYNDTTLLGSSFTTLVLDDEWMFAIVLNWWVLLNFSTSGILSIRPQYLIWCCYHYAVQGSVEIICTTFLTNGLFN